MTSTPASSCWRPRGDRATTILWEAPNHDDDDNDNDDDKDLLPPRDIWDSLKHGDLVYDPNGFRASGTFVVVAIAAGSADGGKEIQRTTNSGGYCEIPSHVSRYIEDPIDFYADQISIIHSESMLSCRVDTIHFDTTVHQSMLARQAGNRPIHVSRSIWYQPSSSGEEQQPQPFQIEIPASPDIPKGGEMAILDSSTPVEYLGNAHYLPQGDPLTLRRRTEIRRANDPSLENGGTATHTFRNMELGQCLELRNFPQPTKDGNDHDDADGVIMGMSATLIRVEPPQEPQEPPPPPSESSSVEEEEEEEEEPPPQSAGLMVPVERVVLDLGGRSGEDNNKRIPTIFELRLCEMKTGDYANTDAWVADNPTRHDDENDDDNDGDVGGGNNLPLAWMIVLWPKP